MFREMTSQGFGQDIGVALTSKWVFSIVHCNLRSAEIDQLEVELGSHNDN